MKPQQADWLHERERGSMTLLRLVVWLGLRLGRGFSRLLLWPITFYFYCAAGKARRASRVYLAKVLTVPVKTRHVLLHIHTFASTLLDRIYFISGQTQSLQVGVQGEADLEAVLQKGQGAILLGAHFGSFEAARALGHRMTQTPLVLLMYQENAQKIGSVLSAVNPDLNQEIISLGQPDCMLKVRQALDTGAMVGILADRTVKNDAVQKLPFLGDLACFSDGPLRLAAVLKAPVFMMVGVYEGGPHYRVGFHAIHDFSVSSGSRHAAMECAQQRYVQLLENHCRRHPYNWFNFYDFWKPTH
jgi:predicted LPLAT superfamily acyltransferase